MSLFHLSCLMSPDSRLLSHVSCLTSPVPCLLSLVSHLLSHVLGISYLMSPVSLCPISCLLNQVTCLTSPVSCLLFHVPSTVPNYSMLNCFKQKQTTTYTSSITRSRRQSLVAFNLDFHANLVLKWHGYGTYGRQCFRATAPFFYYRAIATCAIFLVRSSGVVALKMAQVPSTGWLL